MPIYEYRAADADEGCEQCRDGFEVLARLADAPLTTCPTCGVDVRKQISAAAVGGSKSGFDQRAKQSGFHKLERLGSGEYEKKY